MSTFRSLISRCNCCGLLEQFTQPDDDQHTLSSEIQRVNNNIAPHVADHQYVDHNNLNPVIQYSQISAGGDLELHHDIFLSHSGAQKGFVKDLYRVLSEHGLSTFLDIIHHSLPLAEPFPIHIFNAASSCKLGVVVLSDEYMCSKWPMLELCAFARAKPFVKILPLFFHLTLSDLKDNRNLKRWRKQWSSFAKSDPQRIDAKEWEEAVKLLLAENGLAHDPRSGGELAFIERIVSYMLSSQSITPRNTYDTAYMQGEARLREIVLKKFEEMEFAHSQNHQGQQYNTEVASSPSSCVLGIYGLPGSGKSTLSRSLENHFSRPYAGKSLHIELPTNPSPPALLQALQGLLKLVTLHIQPDPVAHIDQLVSIIKRHGLSKKAIFLAVDNISNEDSITAIARILPHVMGARSKVILTAHTREVLQSLLAMALLDDNRNTSSDCITMPCINEGEAMDILLQTVGRAVRRPNIEPGELPGGTQLHLAEKQKVLKVVRMCGFTDPNNGNSLMYFPSVMERMGAELITHQIDIQEWIHDQQRFWNSFDDQDVKVSREDIVTKLIWESFQNLDEQLQLLFLDLVLLLPKIQEKYTWLGLAPCTPELEDAYHILGSMHGHTNVAETRHMVQKLRRLCFVQRLSYNDVVVHDIYREFANTVSNGKSFKGGVHGVCSYSDKTEVSLDGGMVISTRPVRAMILDAGPECEELNVQNFPHLQALFVRNCESLETLKIAGMSPHELVILDVTGFGSKFPRLDCSDDSLVGVKKLGLLCLAINSDDEWTKLVFFRGYNSEIESEYGMHTRIRVQPDIGIAMQMKGLRNLVLRGTGIQKLEDMGSCWPLLQELQVHECLLTEFRLGTLPHLTNFVYRDCIQRHHHEFSYDDPFPIRRIALHNNVSIKYFAEVHANQLGRTKVRLEGEGLLSGCPSLKDVRIASAFLCNADRIMMNPSSCTPRLRVLELLCVDAKELPDLSSCMHTLQFLTLAACKNLKKVDLSAGFGSLIELCIIQCDRLVELKLGSLPSLLRLSLAHLFNLHNLSGLQENHIKLVQQLELLNISGVRSRHIEGLLSFIKRLQNNSQVGSLQYLMIAQFLQEKYPASPALQHEVRTLTTDQLPSHDLAQQLMDESESGPIETLSFTNFRNLTTLALEFLRHLRCVEGIESLIHLGSLNLRCCNSLEMLPSLHALQQLKTLFLQHCVKLRAVQGCDETRELRCAKFHGCESLEVSPFRDMHSIEQSHPQLTELTFEECKFACINRHLMVTWTRVGGRVVRQAVLRQGLWEYYYLDEPQHLAATNIVNEGNECKRRLAKELVIPCIISLLPLDKHNSCIGFKELDAYIMQIKASELWGYVDPQKLINLMKEYMAKEINKFEGDKPKEMLIQQWSKLASLFCNFLDICRSDENRQTEKKIVLARKG